MNTTKKPQLFKVVAPKVKVITKGYINLISRKKTEANKNGKPIVYRSKLALKIGQQLRFSNMKFSKLFNQCFAQVSILESNVILAKEKLKKAKGSIMSTLEWFSLHVEIAKAKLHLRQFKYSLPRTIRFNLF
jgi:hypothetical protein